MTAREEPYVSEDDTKSTTRPTPGSTRTSQSTVRQISKEKKQPRALGLGLGFESNVEDNLTPRTRGEFSKFDGDWASPNEVERIWDDNLGRHVTVRKEGKQIRTPQTPASQRTAEVVEDNLITPTNATKALRSVSLQGKMAPSSKSREVAERERISTKSAVTESPDRRRHSGMSSKSNVSTVVEAFLVEAAPSPQRRQTLRHIKKRGTLRDSNSDISPQSSAPSSLIRLEETVTNRPSLAKQAKPDNAHGRQTSYTSTTTFNSISSSKARREVWKSGGIPVVVVPDRRSSNKPSRTPSLRSTSSRRSKRSQSLQSVPRTTRSRSNEPTPVFERPGRRARALSESDGSDQRTIDFPPVIPARSSSLSAPTSRNNSRAGSLKAESVKSQKALVSPDPPVVKPVPSLSLHRAPSFEAGQDDYLSHRPLHGKLEVDHHGDPFFGKRLSTQNTPFSIGSVETNGTAPELAEATAVNLYPHQNSSVLMVDHYTKSSQGSTLAQADDSMHQTPEKPRITTTAPDGEFPTTPPQPKFSLDDVDSPLRNPRAPPEPPLINFIPATPSGLTPGVEKQKMLGNYFEQDQDVDEEPPKRTMSLVRKALSGRHRSAVSYPPKASRSGFLTRTWSLSRNLRRPRDLPSDLDDYDPETPPAEANKLHPHWRPANGRHSFSIGDDYFGSYPPIDNRPKRSLSQRMKRTFAIFPLEDEYDIHAERYSQDSPERRIIGRSPSGNLRVMKRRNSLDSLDRCRPATAPEDDDAWKPVWRRRDSQAAGTTQHTQKQRRFSLSGTLGELQGLPRRLSEKRREKRTQELRSRISGPREVRDGVGEVIRRGNFRATY